MKLLPFRSYAKSFFAYDHFPQKFDATDVIALSFVTATKATLFGAAAKACTIQVLEAPSIAGKTLWALPTLFTFAHTLRQAYHFYLTQKAGFGL